jgi:endo-1,4-beta-xylanase
MAAIADRYPNLPLIDVVNEPMHAPPVYAEALGGAGATGYDWVLNAFTLARTYFPNSELLLNEYQVLVFEQYTQDYLKIINALQDEGLIDGIGEQGHFLERADVAEVASNLELLAATGLPIYISEFDVDLENDARHANVFKDLFSVFWDHPSVLGVTHWGHLEGSMWRTNAYLIRQDKSERPALQWVNCYSNGGTNCAVPTYVPQPWVGDANGITLEAELYDEAEGVLALGGVVAYTDDSDWIGYSNVQLKNTWDKFKVTYAKGSSEVGTISVHLDSLENAPVIEVPLPATAGWGTNDTIEVPWPAVGGSHAVFVRFNNTFGVANLDSIQFAKTPVVDTGVELITNGEFETNTNGWYTWNGAASVSSDRAHGGTKSLLISGSSATGPAATNLMGLVQPGVTYAVSFWVSVGGGAPSQVNLTQALNCGGSTSYSWIANNNAVPNNGWVQLTGPLAIPATCNVQGLQVWAEGSGANVPLYVDSVSIKGPSPTAPQNMVTNGDFESDANGWFSWNGSVSSSAAKAQKGSRSLLVSGGSGTGPAATNISGIQAGATYNVSFWVSVGKVASAQVNVTRALTCGGNTSYSWVGNNGAVSADSWTQLSGSVAVPSDCASPALMVYAEGGGANVDLYVDNVSVTKAP